MDDQAILASAENKLITGSFPLSGLPKTPVDPLWYDIKTEYGLTLPELAVLKGRHLQNSQGK